MASVMPSILSCFSFVVESLFHEHHYWSSMSVNILIAESDVDTGMLLKAYLQKHQCDVTIAESGESFFAHFFNQISDLSLVIINIMLNDTDGFSMSHLVRLNSDIPIIMLTGSGADSPMVSVPGFSTVPCSVNSFLAKPFHPSELLRLIEQVTHDDRIDAYIGSHSMGVVDHEHNAEKFDKQCNKQCHNQCD